MKLPVLPVISADVPPFAPRTGLRARERPARKAAEGAGGGGFRERAAAAEAEAEAEAEEGAFSSSAAPTAADLSAKAWSSISSPRDTRANCSRTEEPLRVSSETPPVGDTP